MNASNDSREPTRLAAVFCVLFLAACGDVANDVPVHEEQSPNAGIDEEAIDDVWHKAKLRGVAFRAIGQEPGWLLEITEGRDILLVTDYGQKRLQLPIVEPVVYQEESRTEYVFDDRNLVIEIRGEACRDSMSGESFAVSVTITRGESQLQGCGRALY